MIFELCSKSWLSHSQFNLSQLLPPFLNLFERFSGLKLLIILKSLVLLAKLTQLYLEVLNRILAISLTWQRSSKS